MGHNNDMFNCVLTGRDRFLVFCKRSSVHLKNTDILCNNFNFPR